MNWHRAAFVCLATVFCFALTTTWNKSTSISTLFVTKAANDSHRSLSGFHNWSTNVTDRTKQRIIEQSRIARVDTKQRNYSDYLIWPNNVTDGTMQRITEQIQFTQAYARQRKYTRREIVILTVGEYEYEDLIEGRTRFMRQQCPITECLITRDAKKYKRTADALLVLTAKSNEMKNYLPKPSHQIWIVRHHESPRQRIVNPSILRDLVNWTINYRRDSTIPLPYGYVTPIRGYEAAASQSPSPPANGISFAAGRKKTVAWIVGNCYHTINGRINYVKELKKYIPVDIYGRCGKRRCPGRRPQFCFNMVGKKYKFYLAFENSNCRDYVTEKVYRNAFRNNIVPVVMGAHRDDYAGLLPPHSYIHVDDFRSPKDLANYLRTLDANDTKYNEYFRWKRDWRLELGFDNVWCRLCAMLHAVVDGSSTYVHWYTNYEKWWNGACYARWVNPSGQQNSWQSWNDGRL